MYPIYRFKDVFNPVTGVTERKLQAKGEPKGMPQLKMTGATPKSGKGLCASCKHAKVVKGQNFEERTVCNGGMFDGLDGASGQVTFRVYECSNYHPMNHPFLHEMREIAWKIESRKRGPVGFGDGVKVADAEGMEIVITPPKRRGEQAPYKDPMDD